MTSRRKICCCPYVHKCQKFFSKDKALSKSQEGYVTNDNFILIGAKYILDLYHSTRKNILADDFLRSVVVSITLFAIGTQLTRELYTSKLSPILRCNYNFIDTLCVTSL
ncbi:uncharacterized protein LOC122630547 [Vespula pensylvanica]|uniref:uncharacterized protein LOC122630547 n=1 Tax=Vespula pensylvanica TaxID=30213 RepID=UPI001CBA4855|nr:uncharacterized protein LOC122630547 [Vespula pensylvanica]